MNCVFHKSKRGPHKSKRGPHKSKGVAHKLKRVAHKLAKGLGQVLTDDVTKPVPVPARGRPKSDEEEGAARTQCMEEGGYRSLRTSSCDKLKPAQPIATATVDRHQEHGPSSRAHGAPSGAEPLADRVHSLLQAGERLSRRPFTHAECREVCRVPGCMPRAKGAVEGGQSSASVAEGGGKNEQDTLMLWKGSASRQDETSWCKVNDELHRVKHPEKVAVLEHLEDIVHLHRSDPFGDGMHDYALRLVLDARESHSVEACCTDCGTALRSSSGRLCSTSAPLAHGLGAKPNGEDVSLCNLCHKKRQQRGDLDLGLDNRSRHKPSLMVHERRAEQRPETEGLNGASGHQGCSGAISGVPSSCHGEHHFARVRSAGVRG